MIKYSQFIKQLNTYFMETAVTGITEVKKTSKNYHETMEQSIGKMKLTFDNASLPQIFAVMLTVGYTAEKIAALRDELTQLEVMYQFQIKEYADESEAQQHFKNKRDEVSTTLMRHRNLARILFKTDPHARVALQLDADVPKAFNDWMQFALSFYAQFAAKPELQTKVEKIGIDSMVVANQRQAIADVQSLKDSLRNETSEAQIATDTRDTAFDLLYPKYTDYIKYAKVLLPDNQLLEALGVTVKSK